MLLQVLSVSVFVSVFVSVSFYVGVCARVWVWVCVGFELGVAVYSMEYGIWNFHSQLYSDLI
jgi:hypothetical protein